MPPVPKPERKSGKAPRDPLGSAWMAKVARVGCVLCAKTGVGYVATAVHHLRDGQGAGQRAQDFLTIALCYEHHQGSGGYHRLGPQGFYQRYKLDELDCLSLTIEAVARMDAQG